MDRGVGEPSERTQFSFRIPLQGFPAGEYACEVLQKTKDGRRALFLETKFSLR